MLDRHDRSRILHCRRWRNGSRRWRRAGRRRAKSRNPLCRRRISAGSEINVARQPIESPLSHQPSLTIHAKVVRRSAQREGGPPHPPHRELRLVRCTRRSSLRSARSSQLAPLRSRALLMPGLGNERGQRIQDRRLARAVLRLIRTWSRNRIARYSSASTTLGRVSIRTSSSAVKKRVWNLRESSAWVRRSCRAHSRRGCIAWRPTLS